jgi:SAM-dependent methyltransferase
LRYSEASRHAPPGAARFEPEDLLRLDRWTLCLLLSPGAAALPPADVRAALSPRDFETLLSRVRPALQARLTQSAPAPDAAASRRRVVNGAFWLLVYSLEPALWDALSRAEHVPPELIAALPPGERVLEVAAGTGRLTEPLAGRSGRLIAVEPSRPLAAVLRRRVPTATIVAGVGQALPLRSGWADVAVACASFGPDAPIGGEQVVRELERCTARGGTVVLVAPESPQWFEAHGYRRTTFKHEPQATPPELADFFGPWLQPPTELLTKTM